MCGRLISVPISAMMVSLTRFSPRTRPIAVPQSHRGLDPPARATSGTVLPKARIHHKPCSLSSTACRFTTRSGETTVSGPA
jgi:hypothetical protein